jgi:hypothetical protein
MLAHMGLQDQDFSRGQGGKEVYRPAHALDHLAEDHVVGEVAGGAGLLGAEDGHVEVAAADLAERDVAAEGAGAREGDDRLFVLFNVSTHAACKNHERKLTALIQSASSSPFFGYPPTSIMPFSLCMNTWRPNLAA